MQTEPTTAASAESEQNRQLFEEYVQIRQQLSIIEARKQELEPLVIEAAMSVLGTGDSVNGKSLVYRSKTADILLQLRTTEPKDTDHPDLEHLAEMVDIERSKALHANQLLIEHYEREIKILEATVIGLSNTDEGLKYAAEYAELKQALTTKKPVLVVKLK